MSWTKNIIIQQKAIYSSVVMLREIYIALENKTKTASWAKVCNFL